tara:strand:+ start:1217 stop:1681 length:465 start_codon:yes stop_codon:yes gene_type:complete
MEYHDLVKDFADRTRSNLQLVRERAESGGKAYEVTQLINSMLGLLVFPQQRYYQNVPKWTMEQLRQKGWPEPVLTGDIGKPNDLQELFRYLRNGITHFNMKFTDSGGVLDGVVIWNHEGGSSKNPKNWQVTLHLDELADITDRFVQLMLGSSQP